MDKYLVIVSDDFGMCHGVNQGIISGLKKGLITTTNLMMPCPWIKQAVNACKTDNISVGIHLVMTCEWQNLGWKPLTQHPDLCDEFGFFYKDYPSIPKVNKSAILAEYQAQLEMCRKMGIEPTHVDSHMLTPRHWHNDIYPQFSDIVDEFCVKNNLFYSYHSKNQAHQYFDSDFEISTRNEADFITWLESRGEGIHMASCHLALESNELENLCDKSDEDHIWTQPIRLNDYAIVSSPNVQTKIKKLGFTLINMEEAKQLIGFKG
jgi:chitin disaccharide deacetylase